MTVVTTTVQGVKTEHEIELAPGGFTCVIHQQGMRLDVPSFVEIGPKQTIACMEAMSQKQWEWISTGELFKILFEIVFDPEQEKHFANCKIPSSIEELNQSDMGVIHVCGIIVLCCEAFFAKKNVFLRNPETYLHPATERMIVGMLRKMMELCNINGEIQTTTDDPSNIEKPSDGPENSDKETPSELVIKWLKCMDPAKKFAQVGNQIYTVADLILEVTTDSPVGKQLVEQFMSNNFQVKKN